MGSVSSTGAIHIFHQLRHLRPMQDKAIHCLLAHVWVLICHRHTVQQDDKEHAVVKPPSSDCVIDLASECVVFAEQPQTGACEFWIAASATFAGRAPVACTMIGELSLGALHAHDCAHHSSAESHNTARERSTAQGTQLIGSAAHLNLHYGSLLVHHCEPHWP